ncbi:hypothetical protein B4096_3702 [Heyndrickxia coagulans]|uniref:Uncharacterized protein n=1 Tax=Heyndrickxia coagulans TaxID=1398 RepID=A0AAN0T6A9_HEYCO|nr:hypothetical protein SB48_HM08orf03877 [Heyndrickxia coagulans]KYC59131.1 hypothetical protein B4100_3632 [Heyndrickxia coagulans]KYC89760.1 hypothetical protein B4096_3702 [Heyndrickxia coagulans]
MPKFGEILIKGSPGKSGVPQWINARAMRMGKLAERKKG